MTEGYAQMKNGGEVPGLALMHLLSCLKSVGDEALSQLLQLCDNPEYVLPAEIALRLQGFKLVREKVNSSNKFELTDYVGDVVASAIIRGTDGNTFAVTSTKPLSAAR